MELHDYPAERVVVAGAPRFDEFFALAPRVSRDAFFAPLGLDPARPTLLYLCSSRFIAARELAFIRTWLAALRASGPPLARCNVLVRPHPDVVLVDDGREPEAVTWPAMRQATGWVQRPFDDGAALVLRTTYGTPEAFFECLHHAGAVVALNTSAELEAGIVGRPVYTVLSTDAVADGQANTVHFNYLLRDHGGFVSYAPDLATHVAQLADGLSAPADTEGIRTFIGRFLRPLGNRPVAPALAEVLIDRADRPRDVAEATDAAAGPANRQPTMLESEPAGDTAARPVDETARATYRLGGPDDGARLYATAITRRSARHGAVALPPALDAWLASDVTPGDVLYDVGAGAGACSHPGGPGARRRGRGVRARVRRVQRAVREPDPEPLRTRGDTAPGGPRPIARAARADLPACAPAATGTRCATASGGWDARRPPTATRSRCAAEPLDEVVRRQQLPPPQALRIAVRSGADAVLRGAAEVLAAHRPRCDSRHAQGSGADAGAPAPRPRRSWRTTRPRPTRRRPVPGWLALRARSAHATTATSVGRPLRKAAGRVRASRLNALQWRDRRSGGPGRPGRSGGGTLPDSLPD